MTSSQESDDCHSDGYHLAMERIGLELLRRDPRYRDPYHHNWDLFSLPCSMEERRSSIVNIICCSMVRSSAILAHLILGTRDPDAKVDDSVDRWHAPTDWHLPINRLLSAILYQTPIHYIDSQDCIWFDPTDEASPPGYHVFLEDIVLMMDFATVADALTLPPARSGVT